MTTAINYAKGIINSIAPNSCEGPKGHFSYLSATISKLSDLILKPAEEPTWNSAFMKTGMGIVGLYNTDNQYRVGELISTGLLFTGIREICYLSYSKLAYRPVTVGNVIKSKRQHVKKISDINFDLSRLVKLTSLVFISGMSLSCLYNYDKLGDNMFFQDHRLTNYNFVELDSLQVTSQILMIIQAAACLCCLKLNYDEIRNINQNAFLMNSPIHEIINTIVLTSFFTQFGSLNSLGKELYNCVVSNLNNSDAVNYCTDLVFSDDATKLNALYDFIFYYKRKLSVINAHGKFTEGNRPTIQFYDFLRYIKNYALISSFKNIYTLFQSNIDRWKENAINAEIQIRPFSNNELKLLRKKDRSLPFPTSIQEVIVGDYIDNSSFNMSKIKEDLKPEEEKIVVKEKKKTKGIANKNSIKTSKNTNKIEKLSCSINVNIDPLEKERTDGLNRVKELRKLYPVKIVAIKSELERAAKFLKGRTDGVEGSKYTLHWTRDGSHLSMKYEIDHGWDSSNQSGNKLDQVLSVLETAYLFGLSKELADKYIKKYSLFNLLRVGKLRNLIYFVLSNKTT